MDATTEALKKSKSAVGAVNAILILLVICAVVGTCVYYYSTSVAPQPPPPPPPTYWKCNATTNVCEETSDVAFPTQEECNTFCAGHQYFGCGFDASGNATGECAAMARGQVTPFATLAACQQAKTCNVVYQCDPVKGCVATYGTAPGPSWPTASACAAACIDRYRCGPDGSCVGPVRTWDDKTYPIANACGASSCAPPPPPTTTTYVWNSQKNVCVPQPTSGAPVTFDACMSASCPTTIDTKYYCATAKACAISQAACCGANTCGPCEVCLGGTCVDKCQATSGGPTSCYKCGPSGQCECTGGSGCGDSCMCVAQGDATQSLQTCAAIVATGGVPTQCRIMNGTQACGLKANLHMYCTDVLDETCCQCQQQADAGCSA